MAGRLIRRTLNDIFRKANNKNEGQLTSSSQENQKLTSSLQDNIQCIKKMVGYSADIVFRNIEIGQKNKINVCIVYTDNLTDTLALQELIDSLLYKLDETEITLRQQKIIHFLPF